MNLIVIGNGFDIAHNMPCKYSCFKCFLETNADETIRNDLEIIEDIYGSNDLWKDFENALGDPDVKKMKKVNKLTGLENVIGKLFAERIKADFFKWIVAMNNLTPKKKFILDKNNYFLNFNYTLLLEKVYEIDKNKILHIHGVLNKDNPYASEEFDFGHGVVESDIVSKQVLDATYKDTKKILEREKVKEFFERIKGVEKIIIVGFSYSFIDFEYFEKLKNDNPNAKWIMGYFSKQDEIAAKNYVDKLEINDVDYEHFNNLFKKLEDN